VIQECIRLLMEHVNHVHQIVILLNLERIDVHHVNVVEKQMQLEQLVNSVNQDFIRQEMILVNHVLIINSLLFKALVFVINVLLVLKKTWIEQDVFYVMLGSILLMIKWDV